VLLLLRGVCLQGLVKLALTTVLELLLLGGVWLQGLVKLADFGVAAKLGPVDSCSDMWH
jgi:hypothetical protein